MPSMLVRTPILLALCCCVLAPAAGAVSLMDQIGPDGSFQEGLSNNSTQISNLYASAPQYDVAVVDDFTLSASASLSTVEAALFAANSATAIASLMLARSVQTEANMSRITKSASAEAAFSPTEPRPPAVSVRLAQSRATDSFGSEVHTGLAS